MPDVEIERLAGGGLEPTPSFVQDLRGQVLGEWRGGATGRRRPWGMWAAAAVAVLAVVGVAGLAGQTHDTTEPSESIVTATSSAASSSSAPPTTTTPVPSTALGHLWVVTWIDGKAVRVHDMPNFVFTTADTLNGWDGCNTFSITPAGGGGTTAGCPEGVVAAPIHGPFTFDSEFELRTSRIVAERFDRTDLEAAPLEGYYRFGDAGTVRLNPSTSGTAGGLEVDGAGCSIASGGIWSATGNVLQFDLARPECAVDDASVAMNEFRVWLLQMGAPGAQFSVHDGPAGGLWTSNFGRVNRIVRMP